ncbi:hypothetical protein KQH82_05730 [bacterium]|nr:hypothetical protein [bacterium]
MTSRTIRTIARLALAAYLLFYLSILVPAHAVLFTCHDSASQQLISHSIVEHGCSSNSSHTHDPERCQICLNGGHAPTLVSAVVWQVALDCSPLETPRAVEVSERPTAHCVASRAPPLG